MGQSESEGETQVAQSEGSDETLASAGEEPKSSFLKSRFYRRHRWQCTLALCFFLFHTAAVLISGSPPVIRNVLKPPFFFYTNGLRMTATWGMFGKYHESIAIYSVLVSEKGKRHAYFPPAEGTATFEDRIIDIRLRKMQSAYMTEKKLKYRGRHFLRYLCASELLDGEPIRFARIEEASGFDEAKHPRELLMQHRCTSAERKKALSLAEEKKP